MLKKLLFGGGGIKEPVEAVGSVLDSLFTSKEEELNFFNCKSETFSKACHDTSRDK